MLIDSLKGLGSTQILHMKGPGWAELVLFCGIRGCPISISEKPERGLLYLCQNIGVLRDNPLHRSDY